MRNRFADVIVLLTVVLMVLAFSAGCKKAPEEVTQETAPVPPEVNAAAEALLVPPPTARADAPAPERLHGVIHPVLTERLQAYIEKTGRVPETIYEFSNTAVDSMPPAPAGMKYVIDPADRTVKAVRK